MKKILSLILITTIIFTGCSKKETQNDTIEETIKDDENILNTTYLEKPTSGRVKSQEPIDNIFIALNILKESASYESVSSGEVIAKKGSIKLATQEVKNRRTVTSYATFNESISISTFVKVAEQLYLTDNTVLKREANKVSSSNVTWKNNVSKLNKTQYLEDYGYSPDDPTRYIINEKTIISDIEIINNGIGRKFTYKFNLDPQIAPYYYKKSVKELSGSSSSPNFKSIEMHMTFDYKWRMTKIEVKEEYDISLSALGNVTCFATLTETFSNIDKDLTIPEQSFFKSKL